MFNKFINVNINTLNKRIALNSYSKYSRYLSTTGSNYKVAIIGSGPSSFYAAKYILEKAPVDTRIDIIEKLPMPFGLVRYGVAPDHQDVKTVMTTFTEIGNNPRVSYYGNVTLGEDIKLETLLKNYSIVLFGTGASSDKILNIKNENITEINDNHRYHSGNTDKSIVGGVLSARSFVNWYNGHPDYSWVGNELNNLKGITDVVIVGQGNVAIDCARVLTNDSSIKLNKSDITDEALECIANSSISKISVIGRRGFIQASFTIKELRELSRLDECELKLYRDEIERSDTEASLMEVKNNRPKKRIVELMRKIAMEGEVGEGEGDVENKCKTKQIDIRFLVSPTEVITDSTTNTTDSTTDSDSSTRVQVKGLKVIHNTLIGIEGKQSVTPRLSETHEEIEEIIPCQLILRSVGYQSVPLSDTGFKKEWFHTKKHVINNSKGRVLDSNGTIVTQIYATGWCKRGPSGIVGTNIIDAKETVQCIIEDIESKSILPIESDKQIDLMTLIENENNSKSKSKSKKDIVDWNDYMVINGVENEVGIEKGKIRDKIVHIDDIWRNLNKT